ncbi:DUF4362 domain-containing protein [Pseudalkalibacillus sp. A8]|uniref:DUF4362 domain-containing protein n=1 Tax=Pseudalkalibacillus sp. A8 TaxID=3382641 RepID=UPI0038B4638C
MKILGNIIIILSFVYCSFFVSMQPAVAITKNTIHEVSENEINLIVNKMENSLKEFEVVNTISPMYTGTLIEFIISTSIQGNDEDDKELAEEIKEKANNIYKIKGGKMRSRFKYHFIYVNNTNGDNLIKRPVDKSLEKEIRNFGKKLTNKVPKNYTKKDAIENGDILFGKDRTPKQNRKLKKFKQNVANDKPDFIRFVQFTTLGDPIITEYQFNGKLIYYRYDSTRDRTKIHRRGEERSAVQDDYCKVLVPDPKMPYITECYKNNAFEF